MARAYGLVLGQGRSGTNWMIDSLDVSPNTFCRNEPDVCAGSAMSSLPNSWRIGADGSALAEQWDQAVSETATHMGERDHRLDHPKTFIHPIPQRLGVAQLSARPKARKLLSSVIRPWANAEWEMPSWVGNLDSPEIFTVLKLVQCYNWAAWVIDNRTNVPIVHVVRHPGGRHESFLRRYVANADSEQTRLLKIEQLRALAVDNDLAERMGPIDDFTLEEAETWFGVYQMEALEHRAAHSPQYLRIVYEEFVAEPAETTERVYEHFGLQITRDVRRRIEEQRTTSVFGKVDTESYRQANGWRDRLNPVVAQRIDQIVDNSSISEWWANPVAGQAAA